jgi:hypothetical protein
MKDLKDQAKSQAKSKISGYGGKTTGTTFDDKGSFGASPVDSAQENRKPDGASSAKPVYGARYGGAVGIKRYDRKPRAAGGRATHPDVAEDKKLVNKMVKPECRTERADGGAVNGKKGTTVNIVISGNPNSGDAPMTPPPRPPAPVVMPPPPPAAPPMPPGGMPGAGMPPGGLMGAPPSPMMRKSGGRVNVDVPVKSPGKDDSGYLKMNYGALGGKGRRQKILAQD